MTDPQNLATTYGYDGLNRLNALAFNGQNPGFTFGYDALSRRTSLTRPNGVTTTYAYDAASSLTSVLHKLGTTVKDGATYLYDAAENRTQRTDKRTNVTLKYGYDKCGQSKGLPDSSSSPVPCGPPCQPSLGGGNDGGQGRNDRQAGYAPKH